MADKRQSDNDLESFTIRIPVWLKGSLERIKGTLGGMTTSDAARLLMETGAGTVEKTLADTREQLDLQRNEKAALEKIVAKWHQDQQFSRAELAFIAQWAHTAYMFTKMSNVKRAPLLANLEAFRAVRSLRKEIYKDSEELCGLDSYYCGNVGDYGHEPLDKRLSSLVAELKDYPNCSQAEFASRCLEVALRDEPVLPVDRLNALLRPHLPALIKLALRGYLQCHDGKPAVPVDTNFSVQQMKHPTPVTRGNMYVGPHILADSLTAAISWENGNVIVTVNSFLEFNELLNLIGALREGGRATDGQRFHFLPSAVPSSPYLLRVSGVQVTFAGTEFDDLRAALEELMEQPVVASEYDRLAWLYGEI